MKKKVYLENLRGFATWRIKKLTHCLQNVRMLIESIIERYNEWQQAYIYYFINSHFTACNYVFTQTDWVGGLW